MWNYFDQMHIWGGFLNIYLHSKGEAYHRFEEVEEPWVLFRKSVFIILTFLILIKTFFFLRLFRSMAHLVSMMKQVFNDLQAFMLFFFILIWIMSLNLSALELGNLHGAMTAAGLGDKLKAGNYPGSEYKYIPKWTRQMFTVLRISLGDFDSPKSKSPREILSTVNIYLNGLGKCLLYLEFL